ncbi:sigma-54-dependent Fis family transcriptional regulator (plasmid) [Photobacterium sp. GJ3]|uniref:sigma-54-dependent transcriptional regulator n=1 Tax=Photobacterium sp. GJ3 TaxID=2829502 RepID=UPI001B8B70A8|nr:sigma-54 dependent transcriptional regulator [Photobacterium sp. GJ3]QUJ69720.1 sigma-54-dependent Fis family transcriptional regulator [Photobacterium sp. GJ3]
MKQPVIFIDDDKAIRDSLGQTLMLEDYQVQLFHSARQALDAFDPQFPGVIITDMNMPGMDGMTFLKHALQIDHELPVIMLTGHGDISTAVDAMRLGAYDFLEKPFSTEYLLDVVKRACDKRDLILENRELKRELASQSHPGPRILGNTLAVKQLRHRLYHLKELPQAVFLQGEEGSGKRMMATFLHEHSQRQHQAMMTIQTQELNDQQAELLLQGPEGKWHAAQGSSLYIENIELLPPQTQQVLVTLLQSQSENTEPSHQVRLIASSQHPLHHLLASQQLLPALMSMFEGAVLEIPPLRERQDDIPLLFQNFIRTAASRYNLEAPVLSVEQEQRLVEHRWPGNVRELRNLAERIVLLGNHFDESQTLEIDSPPLTLVDKVTQFEFTLLSDALRRHNGRLKDVQSELGIARKTLYDKMKKHGLDKEDFKESN